MSEITVEILEKNLTQIFPEIIVQKISNYFWFVCHCGCDHEWICNLTEFCNNEVVAYGMGIHPPDEVEFYVDEHNQEQIEILKKHKTFISMKRDMPSGYRFWQMRMTFSSTRQRFEKYLPPEYWHQGKMRGVNIRLW